jgi:hypothetical protein
VDLCPGHAFAQRLLGADTWRVYINYLRAFTFDRDILRVLDVRFVVANAQTRRICNASGCPSHRWGLRLYGTDVNLGTYSPTQFVKATTAGEVVGFSPTTHAACETDSITKRSACDQSTGDISSGAITLPAHQFCRNQSEADARHKAAEAAREGRPW